MIKYVTIGDKQIATFVRDDAMIINNTKYDNHIRIGHTATGSYGNYVCSDLQDFPVPTAMTRRLHDTDVDAYTDLLGFTHRNRVRNDVEDFDLSFAILNDTDMAYILNRIQPEWIYVELTNKKTGAKTIHRMYASDKEFNTYHTWKVNNSWVEANTDLTFSLVEE